MTSTTGLTQEMQIFYDKIFLETADLVRKYDTLTVKKSFSKNSGTQVNFTRSTVLPAVTTALTEGTNPTVVDFSATTVSAQVAEYGNSTKITSLFELTTIDAGLEEKTRLMGENAGRSLDTMLRDAMIAGATKQFAGGKTAMTAVAATDLLSAVELRKAFLTLFNNAAPTFEGGNYRMVVHSQGQYELQGDTTTGNWVNVNIYNDGSNAELVKKGVLGRLFGFDMVPTNNGKSEASTVSVYHTIAAGKGAVAEVDIAGSGSANVIYKQSGAQDTSNPLNMYSTLGWKVDAWAAKVLNANWIVDIVHA